MDNDGEVIYLNIQQIDCFFLDPPLFLTVILKQRVNKLSRQLLPSTTAMSIFKLVR